MTDLVQIEATPVSEEISPADAQKLDQLATAINGRDRVATRMAIRNGEALLEAKKILGHGRFTDWCTRRTGYELRTAQILMTLALFARRDRALVSGLGLSAAYRLAAPSMPEPVIVEILGCVKRGEKVTLRQIDNLVQNLAGKEGDDRDSQAPETTIDVEALAARISTLLNPEQKRQLSSFLDRVSPTSFEKFKNALRGRSQNAHQRVETVTSFAVKKIA